ncbi:MAG: Hint domain-containing protein [Methylorubrum rhodinum]|uniref:Hint domain-containing protein n=1 Tax=Methylorubrum rhodinum TaxID=29428 RepID=UPI003BB0CC27
MAVTFNTTGALQYYTISQGTYTINANGAAGGSLNAGRIGRAGYGASVSGSFTFQSDTPLIILVGQAGETVNGSGNGGGGGSFVFIDTDNDNTLTSNDELLIAAGGGGGAAGSINRGFGGLSLASSSGTGAGGAAGGGSFFNGGGGAGVNGPGGTADPAEGLGGDGQGAPSITQGGAGSGSGPSAGGDGGFGGGGGGAEIDGGGGGGGGYSGGQGGSGLYVGGRGGTSYIAPSATNTISTADTRQGDGLISIVCYVTGTRIRTMTGEIAVEALRVGDFVVTASGAPRPVRWIGHRVYRCRGDKNALPVRITAHAFGPGRPTRDLFVSPAHAVAVEAGGEVLVPAVRLINGTTVAQVEVETVTYWHVELDSHDILLAEGLPAESYLDCGNRSFFANADITDLAATPCSRLEVPLSSCRPFHEVGPAVEAVRARLEERAVALGWRRVEDTFAGLHLVADGRTIHPTFDGLCASFVLPADARNVRLVSETGVPAYVVPGSHDDRRLGVCVVGIAIDDGTTGARHVAPGDDRLREGWHEASEGARWTDGAAALPAELWAGCEGVVRLDVALAGPALPRWVEPQAPRVRAVV